MALHNWLNYYLLPTTNYYYYCCCCCCCLWSMLIKESIHYIKWIKTNWQLLNFSVGGPQNNTGKNI